MNFFSLDGQRRLVDLPGYGYAKVPEAMRRHWRSLMEDYFSTRRSLAGLVLVMDCRHPLTDFDQQMLAWTRAKGCPVHVLLTKADKLSRAATQEILRDTRTTLAARSSSITVQCFSSLRKFGVREAADTLGSWLGPANEIDDR